MKNEPLVSIITVNYNQAGVTAGFLDSLKDLTYKNFEVIVVDNASKETSAFLKTRYPFITHVTSPANTGFAGGNNLGLFFAKGEYVLFINNDTEVTPSLLTVLTGYLQSHTECAIACPKIKYYYQSDTIQYAGTVGPTVLTSRSHDIGYQQKDDGSYNDERVTDQPNGAAMMIPMHLIKQVGLMSELFFLYYEELDWAARFKQAGYQVHYVGTTQVYHKESVSTGKNSAFKTFYLHRNRLLYIRRNYKGINKLIGSGFFSCISTPLHFVKHAVKGEWKHSAAIIRALCWNITHSAFTEPAIHTSTLKEKLLVS